MIDVRQKYAFNRCKRSFLAYDLKIANTHWTRLKGLLGTSANSFAFGNGLWIIPCQGVHTFAMRYPIDVVYLDHDNTVIRFIENVRPWRITPVIMESASILELPARTIWNTGTEVGDSIEIENLAGRDTTSAEARASLLQASPSGLNRFRRVAGNDRT